MKTILLSIILLLTVGSTLTAQSSISEILIQVEANSTQLKALQQQMEAQKLANRTDIYLPNPEAEFGYLWGVPKAISNRIDISVKQSFDFPTVYSHKSKLANIENTNAEWAYKTERVNLLLAVKETCVQLIYCNALIGAYKVRMDNALTIAQSLAKMTDAGEGNILEVNKAQINLITVKNEIANIETERQRLLSDLKRYNGDKEIIFTDTLFEAAVIPDDFEQWYIEAESKSPALGYLKGVVEADKKRVQVNQAVRLPKFSAGYASESIPGEQYHGISIGISVPLWENKNKVKMAKAQAMASQLTVEDARIAFYNNLQYLFSKATTLKSAAESYGSTLQTNNNDILLKKAWQTGNLSLLNYLLESQYYYTAIENKLSVERDLALTIAQLEWVNW